MTLWTFRITIKSPSDRRRLFGIFTNFLFVSTWICLYYTLCVFYVSQYLCIIDENYQTEFLLRVNISKSLVLQKNLLDLGPIRCRVDTPNPLNIFQKSETKEQTFCFYYYVQSKLTMSQTVYIPRVFIIDTNYRVDMIKSVNSTRLVYRINRITQVFEIIQYHK